MKAIFRFLVPCLFLTACFTPPKDCISFKTGTFEYTTYADGELIAAKIVRNDSIEIDYFDPQQPDTSAIRWVNDCEYILRKYNPKSSDEKTSFKMKIIETDPDNGFYTFQFSQMGQKIVKEFSAQRVKE